MTNDYLKVGRCEFCKQLLVVMDTSTGSVLPVEVNSKDVKINVDEEFDSKKFKSHLLNCSKQQAAWNIKKKKIMKKRMAILKMTTSDLLK